MEKNEFRQRAREKTCILSKDCKNVNFVKRPQKKKKKDSIENANFE